MLASFVLCAHRSTTIVNLQRGRLVEPLWGEQGKGKDGKKSKLGKDGAGANDAKKRVDFATPAPPNRSGSGPADDDEPGVSTAVYSADGAVALLCQLGKGIAALEEYKCADAIEHFHGLPDNHFRTAWTYCQIGRANFELADYKEASPQLLGPSSSSSSGGSPPAHPGVRSAPNPSPFLPSLLLPRVCRRIIATEWRGGWNRTDRRGWRYIVRRCGTCGRRRL